VSALLAAERIHVRHPRAERDAVRDVSLALQAAEIVALVGPNGSGKSSLLGALAGELAPRAGRVTLDGADLARVPRRQRARRIARLPQEPACPEGLTVEQLVAHGRHPHRGAFEPHGPEDRRAIADAIAAFDLADLRGRAVETLSGGERRRAWLALVLAQEPEILLLDEPTTALDLRQRFELLALLQRVHRERGLSLLVSLHDLEEAAALAQRVAVLHRGRLYECSHPELALRAETLCDVFGVDARVEKEDGFLRVRVQGPATPLRSL
jgi:iron complex transport system ATP-binding protein